MAGKDGSESKDRRSQIIDSAIGLMSDHGVSGATTARIAADVGVSEPTLYRHFKNKQEILLSALDVIAVRLMFFSASAASDANDVVERVRLMSGAIYDFGISNPEETRVLWEAISATRDEEMRESLRTKFTLMLKLVEGVLAEGISQGEIREDIDVSLTAWEIASLGNTLYLALTLGLENELTKDKAMQAIDRLLDSIVTDDYRERRAGK
ncbi:MAG TPA: TetR/AcrR family transcriptional regulator [Candidatus Anoxymicrobiaceae bacterium]